MLFLLRGHVVDATKEAGQTHKNWNFDFRNAKVVDFRYALICLKCQCHAQLKRSRFSDTFQVLAQGQRVEASRYQDNCGSSLSSQ